MKTSTSLSKFISIFIWVLIWQVASLIVGNSLLLASPIDAIKSLFGLCMQSEFWLTVLYSLARISAGFLLGLVFGILLALVSYKQAIIREFLAPLVHVLKSVPLASFIVLLIIWWGSKGLSISVSFIVVFPSIYLAVLDGLASVSRDLKDMSKVFRLPPTTKLRYVYFPAINASLQPALKLSLGMCWKSGVAAEVIGTPAFSLGEGLYMSKIYLDTAGVLAYSLMVVVLSFLFEKIVMTVYDWFMKHDIHCKPPLVPVVGQRNVSMVFQENALIETASAIKNVEMVTGDATVAREALMKLLPIECLSENVSTLSGGMKRRVAIVRAVEADSDLLLLDEPFAGLDEENKEKALAYIKSNSRGRTIIIATH